MSRRPLLAIIFTLLVGSIAVSTAGAQTTSTLTGRVTDAVTGAPLISTSSQGTDVVVCGDGLNCVDAFTDADGRYTLANLAPGTYYLRTFNPDTHVRELFDDIPCAAFDCRMVDGTPIVLSAGETRVIDLALTPAGTITGTVTDAATGAPVQFAAVNIFNAQTAFVTSGTTAADGSYRVGSLPTGSYFVSVTSSSYVGNVPGAVECATFSSVGCRIASAPPVAVTAGLQSTFNVALTPAAAIVGTVRDAATGQEIFVDIVGTPGLPFRRPGLAVPEFAFSPLPPGRYRLQTRAGRFFPTSFGSIPSLPYVDQSVDVTLAAGETARVEIALSRGQSIAGAFIPPADDSVPPGVPATNFHVDAYDASGTLVHEGHIVPSSNPGARWPAGYIIEGLAPGRYYIRFSDPDHPLSRFFNRAAGGIVQDHIVGLGTCITEDCDVRRGRPIEVGASAPVTGIDIPLAIGGSIQIVDPSRGSYQLYDARGVRVDASFRSEGTLLGTSNPATFLALPDGTYFLRTTDGRDCRSCAATSDRPIEVRPPRATTVTLTGTRAVSPLRRVSGTIRDAASMTPLSTIVVSLASSRTGFSTSTSSDMLGRFDLSVQAGEYQLRTGNDHGYVDRTVTVTVRDTDLTGVELTLDRGGVVTAAVLDESAIRVGSIPISFFDAAQRSVATAATTVFGSVDVTLPPGTYFARSGPIAGRVMQLHGGAACPRGACDVTSGVAIPISLSSAASMTIGAPSCTAPDVSPRILASAVSGHVYRQVFNSSHPSSGFLLTEGTLPTGLSLDPATGALTGTPTESGVFSLTVAAVDGGGCAGVQRYTLQVAQCAFSLSPASATLPADGGVVDIVASDVCGLSAVESPDPWVTTDSTSVSSGSHLTLTVAQNPTLAARFSSVIIGRRVFAIRQAAFLSGSPFGSLDAPAVNSPAVSGSTAVGGWALDDVEVARVRIYRDPIAGETQPLVFIGDAVFVDGARPDVEQAFPSAPFKTRGGWGYLLLTNMLPNQGNGTFVLHAIAEDAEGHATELGTRAIVAANTVAVAPFGAIDTPGQGEVVSGSAYVNFGWALTPRPKSIPADGSTMQVLIDGVPIGSPSYNFFRADVSGLFPGLANSAGPVGFRVLDTTALQEGAHTIAWVVTDSAGVTEGIGSRYFAVRNSADAPVARLTAGADVGRASASLPDPSGHSRSIRLNPLSHVALDVAGADEGCGASYAAYLVVAGELRDLPIGATLERGGRLSWQPGPAFHGLYDFAVVRTDCEGRKTTTPIAMTVR